MKLKGFQTTQFVFEVAQVYLQGEFRPSFFQNKKAWFTHTQVSRFKNWLCARREFVDRCCRPSLANKRNRKWPNIIKTTHTHPHTRYALKVPKPGAEGVFDLFVRYLGNLPNQPYKDIFDVVSISTLAVKLLCQFHECKTKMIFRTFGAILSDRRSCVCIGPFHLLYCDVSCLHHCVAWNSIHRNVADHHFMECGLGCFGGLMSI